MKRISKDEYFLALANLVSTRATCDRLWAGTVLVKDGEVLATGYNGAPAGMPECNEVGHLLVVGEDNKPHCVRTIHDSENAVLQTRRRVPNLEGVAAYTNATPCEKCLSLLLRCGVRRFVCGGSYGSGGTETSKRLIAAWGAIMECVPTPEVIINFGIEFGEVKRVKITRKAG